MVKKIVCGPENVKEFNAQLRQALPEFHALAKELHASGMISGLAGASLELAPFDEEEEEARSTRANVCGECIHWKRDSIGDGTGLGTCLIGALKTCLKWPKQNACRKWEEA